MLFFLALRAAGFGLFSSSVIRNRGQAFGGTLWQNSLDRQGKALNGFFGNCERVNSFAIKKQNPNWGGELVNSGGRIRHLSKLASATRDGELASPR